MHQLPYESKKFFPNSLPLELIHADVWGLVPISSVDGFHYYVLFDDDASRYNWLFPIKKE